MIPLASYLGLEALAGKILGNKSVIDKISELEEKLSDLVKVEICETKHNALKELVDTHFLLINEKIDKLNNK